MQQSILFLAYCDRITFCYRELGSSDTDYSPCLLVAVKLVETFERQFETMYQESYKYLYLQTPQFYLWELNLRLEYKDIKRYIQENVHHNVI